MSLADLPLELIGEIAGESGPVYHALVLAYPRFARSLTLGDRLDFAEKFGYDCRVERCCFDKFIWTKCHKLHRTDGPAVEYADGDKEWWVNGKRHRIGEPAIDHSTQKVWYVNGKRHRIGGPAVERNVYTEWYVDGKLHRIDGPAVEYADGSRMWYINNVIIDERQFMESVNRNAL